MIFYIYLQSITLIMKQNLSSEELDFYQQLTKEQSCKVVAKNIKDNNNFRGSVIKILKKLNDNQREGLIVHLQILAEDCKDKQYEEKYKAYLLSFIERMQGQSQNLRETRIIESQIYLRKSSDRQEQIRVSPLSRNCMTSRNKNLNWQRMTNSLRTSKQKERAGFKQQRQTQTQIEMQREKNRYKQQLKKLIIETEQDIQMHDKVDNKEVLDQLRAFRHEQMQMKKQKSKNDEEWYILIVALLIIILLCIVNLQVGNYIIWIITRFSVVLFIIFFSYKIYSHTKDKGEDKIQQENVCNNCKNGSKYKGKGKRSKLS